MFIKKILIYELTYRGVGEVGSAKLLDTGGPSSQLVALKS